jgi:hypothetical protein
MVAIANSSRFPLGQVVATPAALHALEDAGQDARKILDRHRRGDWGNISREDADGNEQAIARGDRILSAYLLNTNVKIWIITEADRTATTILLPDEY